MRINIRHNIMVEKIVNILLNILIFIFGIILLISIYTGLQTKVLGNDYANFFGYSLFEVQTGSMAETINAGDWIVIRLTSKVKLDDIVTYRADGEFITHRVIEVYSGTYITKGDANNTKDDPVDESQIVGKVVNIWPSFGILRKTLFNPAVFITLIITMYLFNWYIKKNSDDKNNKKEEKIVDKLDNILDKIKSKIYKIKKENKEETELFKAIGKNTNDMSFDLRPISKLSDKPASEEELEKTMFYRKISVDAKEEEVKDEKQAEEELSKTSVFRVISVDTSDANKNIEEIRENKKRIAKKEKEEKNKLEEKNKKIEEKAIEKEIEEEKKREEENRTLTNVELEILKNKKSKNVIDKVILFKKDELSDIVDDFMQLEKDLVSTATIKKSFIDKYINIRYYNYPSGKSKSINAKLNNAIKEISLKLIKEYNGKNDSYKRTIDVISNIFKFIIDLEKLDGVNRSNKDECKKLILKYFKNMRDVMHYINDIVEIQKKYNGLITYFLKNLETDMFVLNQNKLSVKKNMYGLELNHNLSFSKVYSDYVIDKTYTEGIVAEDKISVLFTLLSIQLVKNMMEEKFELKYILCLPDSLYKKERKVKQILTMVDDEFAKESVIILIPFNDLCEHFEAVKKIKLLGYKFALAFDEDSKVNSKNSKNMYATDYIFINKKEKNYKEIISAVPKDLNEKVIYENVVSKVGDFREE